MRKILYSRGFGAGWTSWAGGSKEFQQFMLTYPPIIEALECGEKMHEGHPVILRFAEEAKAKFNEEPYLGGADGLKVATVSGLVRITEYDGAEGFEEPDSVDYL